MDCKGCRYYKNLADNHCIGCDGSGYTKPSNADRIRAMSDEELATRIKCPKTTPCIHLEDDYPCVNCKLDWLRKDGER